MPLRITSLDHFGASVPNVIHEEQGVIPIGTLSLHDADIPGLGANAGAIRPASGYTFVFIHQQIQRAIEVSKQGKPLRFKRPHKSIDVWMDAVLFTVLRTNTAMCQSCLEDGFITFRDEFVRFMSGQAQLETTSQGHHGHAPSCPSTRAFQTYLPATEKVVA